MTSFSISDLRDRLALLDDKIAAAERAVEVAERRLAEAKVERAGAEAFINSLEAPASRRGAGNPGISSTVLAVLQAHPEGVRLEDVPRLAVEMGGPELDGEQVRSAVKHLGRTKLAENIRRGLWRAKTDAPENTDGPAEAGPSDEAPPPLIPEVRAG